MSDAAAPDSPKDDITPDQIAIADQVVGRDNRDEHRAQMAKQLTKRRNALTALRTSDRAEGQEPALLFSPLLPGIAAPDRGSENIAELSEAPLLDYNGDPNTLAFASAADLARLLRAGKVTSRELTAMYLARLKEHSPRLNCVVNLVPDDVALARAETMDREIAAGQWRGPLHGIPYGAKDLFATRGLPTTYGAKPYENQVFDYDAAVIERMDAAGAVLLGKLSMGELAMGDVWFGGTTRNPWRPEDGSSGSSAGSASAVAAGLVGFALGTETCGSIVSPSVVCGVIGLRPTFGRVSRYGAMALSWSMDKIGPMCRSAEDCALVFAAIQGPDPRDATTGEVFPFRWEPEQEIAGLRVGCDKTAWEKMETDEKLHPLLPIYEEALRVLEGVVGAPLTPVCLPESTTEYDSLIMLTIGVEAAASFAKLIAAGGMDELVQQDDWNWPNQLRAAAQVPATEYLQAQRVRAHLQREMAQALEEVDLYVTIPRAGPSLPYTNLTGHPEIVLRCGRTAEGLPVSLSLVGGLYQEDALLRVAAAWERATRWHRDWPTVETGRESECARSNRRSVGPAERAPR